GAITLTEGAQAPDPNFLNACLAELVGALEQVPPAYSAAKVTGRRAYDLTRQGAEVTLQPRRVEVHAIDVHAFNWPLLEGEVQCGKGTYIRSLARDLGERLGCGALVLTLRRTRVGPFCVEDALSLENSADEETARLLPAAQVMADQPSVTLSAK